MNELISQFWIYVGHVGSLVGLIMGIIIICKGLLNVRTKIKWLKITKCPKSENHLENKNRELILFSTTKLSDEKKIETYICRKCYGNPYKKRYYYKSSEKTPKDDAYQKYIWGIRWVILKIILRKNKPEKKEIMSS